MGVHVLLQCIIFGFFIYFSSCELQTINVLVVLVQFSNHASRTLPTQEDLNQLWNGPGDTTLVPGESVAGWMASNSYGKIQVQASVSNWYQLAGTEAEASFGNMGNAPSGSAGLERILQPALENTGFNLTDFTDDNGDLIGVIFVHSGYAAEQGGVDPDGANYLDRIASKSWSVNVQIEQGARLQTFATVSAIKGTSNGIQMAGIGHHIHEWVHARFGLHDLDDLGGRYNNSTVAPGGIGAFGIMSFPEGPGYDAAYPGMLNPYYKIKIGVLEPIDIVNDGVYRLNSSNLEPSVYRIQAPYPPGEYLLIENRQPVLSDKNLWAPGGIVIYHIDELADGNKVRGGPFVEGWPGNGAHYQVAVLQADGKYELEKALNLGDPNDFWKAGDVLGPGNGELVATLAGTYPNTDSYQGGNIAVTSLRILNFTDEGNGEWSFEVADIVSKIKTPPLFVVEPIRCSIYSVDFFPGPDFECNCKSDCDPTSDRHVFCNCDEGAACCSQSNAPSGSPGEPSSLPSYVPSLRPSLSPSTIPSDLPSTVPSSQPSSLPSIVPTIAPVTATPVASQQGAAAAEDASEEPGNIVGYAVIGLIILGVLGYLGYLQWQKKKKDEEQNKTKETKKKTPPPEPEDPKDEEEVESQPLTEEKSFKDEDDSDSDADDDNDSDSDSDSDSD